MPSYRPVITDLKAWDVDEVVDAVALIRPGEYQHVMASLIMSQKLEGGNDDNLQYLCPAFVT